MGLQEEFDKIKQNISKEVEEAVDNNPAEQILIEQQEREDRWLKKREGKLTSSKNDDLMKKGRGKYMPWGDTAIKVLLDAYHEKRTGVGRHKVYAKAMEWGKSYEAEAINYYAKKYGVEVKNCSTDFDEIVFVDDVIEGYGDSPDAYVGDDIVLEFKCPYNGSVHLKNCVISVIDDTCDYYWQLIGHMIPDNVKEVHFCSYDPRMDEDDPWKLHVVVMKKEDYIQDVNILIDRIKAGVAAIESDDIMNILNINSYESN